MDNLQNEDEAWSESDIDVMARATGLTKEQLFEKYNEPDKPDIPDGKISDLTRDQKTKIISEIGYEGYKKLVDERS